MLVRNYFLSPRDTITCGWDFSDWSITRTSLRPLQPRNATNPRRRRPVLNARSRASSCRRSSSVWARSAARRRNGSCRRAASTRTRACPTSPSTVRIANRVETRSDWWFPARPIAENIDYRSAQFHSRENVVVWDIHWNVYYWHFVRRLGMNKWYERHTYGGLHRD